MTESQGNTQSVVLEREFSHPPEKLWRALTQGWLIEEWLMKNDFEPVVGRKFNLRTDPMPHWNGVLDCEVLTVEPHTQLAYTWNGSGDEAADGLKTVVTFTLTPTPRGVLLRMEQSGFRPQDQANYQGAQYGWPYMFNKLEDTVNNLE